MRAKVIIMGAAGRDFHNFNVYFRDNANYEVVAFTATQIPNIEGRKYPASLAGKLYPRGIDIHPEKDLPELIKKNDIEQVILAYSDLNDVDVMHKAAIVNAAGADFRLMGMNQSALKAKCPVIAVCAVRTGSGKSQTTRAIASILRAKGKKVVAIRHPMPYGDLEKQVVERFATYEDLDKYETTIEEREEYEPHIDKGIVVYAGVDYEKILRQAEKEADVILWDGGNNDTPFYFPDLQIVVADPHRAEHAKLYYPGETNVRMADVLVVNKVNVAPSEAVKSTVEEVQKLNPGAPVALTESVETIDRPELVKGKEVLVVEDGPSVTHGGLAEAVGARAARLYGGRAVDPREWAVGSIKEAYSKFPHMASVMPSLGYSREQLKDLEDSINAAKCDTVLLGTPANLSLVLKIRRPVARVMFVAKDASGPSLAELIKERESKLTRR